MYIFSSKKSYSFVFCLIHSSYCLQVSSCANDILTKRDLRLIPRHQVPRELQVRPWLRSGLRGIRLLGSGPPCLPWTNQRQELPDLSQSEARSPCLQNVRDPGRICAGKQKSQLRLLHCVMLRWWYITTLHYSHSQSHLRTSETNKKNNFPNSFSVWRIIFQHFSTGFKDILSKNNCSHFLSINNKHKIQ